jgi:hypothetical protein
MTRLVNHPAFNIATFAMLLSLPWEFGQMWLYAGSGEMSHLQGIRICSAATVGDAVIMLTAFGIVSLGTRSQDWVRAPTRAQVAGFVLIGLAVTVVVELVATRSDSIFSWRYTASMPVTPYLGIGFAPILMWLIVPLLVLWFVRRQIGDY